MTVEATQVRTLVFQEGLSGPVLAALAASVASRTPFRFESEQASALLSVLAPVCGAQVRREGAASVLMPGCEPRGGAHRLSLPSDVSCASVLAALASALGSARQPVTLRLEGTTHPRQGTTFHDFALAWAPQLARAGLVLEAALEVASFSPEANGVLAARFFPSPRAMPIEAVQRGLLSEVKAVALVPSGARQAALLLERAASLKLRAAGIAAQAEALPIPTRTRTSALVVDARFERVRACFTSIVTDDDFEAAAARPVEALQHFMGGRGALQSSMAESLLVPAAIAASRWAAPGAIGGAGPCASRFTTSEVTLGLLAAADVLRTLLDVEVHVQGLPGHEGLVRVRPRA